MTLVHFDLRTPTVTGTDEPAVGHLALVPTRRLGYTGHITLPAPFTVVLAGGEANVELAPTGIGWCWLVEEVTDGGRCRAVAVPDQAEAEYGDLVEVNPETLEPGAEPEAAWWAALELQIQGPPGPAGPTGAASTVPGPEGPIGPTGLTGNTGGLGPQGPQGIQGVEGPEGPQGPQGEQGVAGATGIEWQGLWDNSIDYTDGDAVGWDSGSWFAAGDPTVGEEPTLASAHWFPLALQGAAGPAGSTGAQGIQGPQGDAGPQGPAGADGSNGSNGAPGATGPAGPAGADGADGADGVGCYSYSDGNKAGTYTLTDVVDVVRHATLTGNITLALPTPAGTAYAITLVLTQDGTGGRTLTLPAGTLKPYGLAPILTTTAGAVDVIQMWCDGVNWWAFLGAQGGAV